jgi:hypothetical protein
MTLEEHEAQLSDFLYQGKIKLARMRVEWDICRDLYQGIATKPQGGVDASLVTALIQTGAVGTNQDIPLDSLKLATMMLFMQSKLTLSEPSAVVKAYVSDEEAHKAARYQQCVIEHIKTATTLKSEVEKDFNLNCGTLGTAVLFCGWNPDGGKSAIDLPDDFDPLEHEFTMEGDYEYRSVSPYNFIIDPNSTNFHYNAENCAELRKIPLHQIVYKMKKRFHNDPEKLQEVLEFLENFAKECSNREFAGKVGDASQHQLQKGQYVLLWEYWERAEPWNGLLGKYSMFADIANADKAKLLFTEEHPLNHKQLPFAVLTDMDVAEDAYGLSRAVLSMACNDAISQLYTQVMANVELHGSIRLLVPEGALSNEYLSDSPYKPINYNAALGEKPTYLQPATVTNDVWRLHTLLEKEIDAVYGANEFSRGEIPRELSSYAVSQAVERDDQFRIRIFNKKKEVFKRIFEQSLENTKQYVTEKRSFLIAGDANSFALESFAGSDIIGACGVFVSYGMYQPADPHAQKQQLLEVVKNGIFEKGGGDFKKLIGTLVDGDMLDIRDMFEAAKTIQKHEVARMMNGEEAPVQPWHEHYAHYDEISRYMNTIQFERLDPDVQTAMFEHSEGHKKAIAKLEADASKAKMAMNTPPTPPPGGGGAVQPPQIGAGAPAGAGGAPQTPPAPGAPAIKPPGPLA